MDKNYWQKKEKKNSKNTKNQQKIIESSELPAGLLKYIQYIVSREAEK